MYSYPIRTVEFFVQNLFQKGKIPTFKEYATGDPINADRKAFDNSGKSC